MTAGLSSVMLAGCLSPDTGPSFTAAPPAVTPQPAAMPAPRPLPSKASLALERYYKRLQDNLLSKGLLRQDRGGPDAPFTDTMLTRNFRAIALGEEYVRGSGLTPSRGGDARVKKWQKPVRMAVEFGDLVPVDQQEWDTRQVRRFAARLGSITGHPINMVQGGANYHVLFATHDDLPATAERIRQLVPEINGAALNVVRTMPRGIHCLVMAFASDNESYEYETAIAVIRAEHPDLLRMSCIHEELAQGLGVGNDSPLARPSIFNDDDEYALLTRHDEMLLQILYDPRLKPGMGPEEALPIVRERAANMLGGRI